MVETYRLNAAAMVVVHCLRALVREGGQTEASREGGQTEASREGARAFPKTLPFGLMASLEAFLRALDCGARRRLVIGDGPVAFATADEAGMIALLADAQAGREAACAARAVFLVRSGSRERLRKAAEDAAAMLDEAGFALDGLPLAAPAGATAEAFQPTTVVSRG